jgi:hypothetical protein
MNRPKASQTLSPHSITELHLSTLIPYLGVELFLIEYIFKCNGGEVAIKVNR